MESIPICNPFPGAASLLAASVGSTQDEARRLAGDSFPPGSVLAAEFQTAGRGRFPERSWASEAGKNLLFTLFLEPGAARFPALPLRLGAALCEALTSFAALSSLAFPSPPRLKWPNDLMFAERKAAGILCEAGPRGVFAGIGLNCNQLLFPPELEEGSTSLAREIGAEVDRWAILQLYLESLAPSLSDPSWRARVESLLWRRGERAAFFPGLEASESRGRRAFLLGRVEGIDEEGSLLFRPEGRSSARAYAAGELGPCRS